MEFIVRLQRCTINVHISTTKRCKTTTEMESINERHKAASHNYREMQNNFEGEKISIKETINTPNNCMLMFNQSQKNKKRGTNCHKDQQKLSFNWWLMCALHCQYNAISMVWFQFSTGVGNTLSETVSWFWSCLEFAPLISAEGQFLKVALMCRQVTWASGNVIHSFFIALHAQINCS